MVSPYQTTSSFSAPKPLLIASVVALALYLFNPSFHWRLAKTTVHGTRVCYPCSCDCDPDAESLIPGCGGNSKLEEVDQKSMDLLKREIKLHESVVSQTQGHLDTAVLDVKRLVSQYQKEAEKCSSGMETCEVAREKAEAALAVEKRVSVMWEKRARELGWVLNNKANNHPNFFDRIGFSSSSNRRF